VSVQSRAFLKIFSDEVRAALLNPEDTGRRWNSSPEWSTLMLGSSETRKSAARDFGIIGRVGRSLGYELQAEYLRVDQIWYTINPDAPEDWRIEAFLEHENNHKRLAETVRKLLELGAGLKVAITYPPVASKAELLSTVSRLIKERHGTPPDSRLTVIFGFLDGEHSIVSWEAHELDGMGRISGGTIEKTATQPGVEVIGAAPRRLTPKR
jgi:hypothetical protein